MNKVGYVSIVMLICGILLTSASTAQKPGIAADKQKQENLEKIKKRQAELKKKYNSLPPEQAEEARRRANEYKKSGGKSTGTGTKPGTTVKTNPSKLGLQGTGSTKPKTSPTSKPKTNKPVWMDSKGHSKPVTPPAPGNTKPDAKGKK
jgi:hypothetical protein